MKCSKSFSVLMMLILAVVLAASWAAAAQGKGKSKKQDPPPPEKLPWSLREHYTFSSGPLRLDYAKDNAEWRIKLFQEDSETTRMHPDVVMRDVGFSIELGDGRLLTNDGLGLGGETTLEREPFQSSHLGEGVSYTIHFVPMEGLAVAHKIETFKQWSFVMVSVAVKNIGEAPASIARINPAVIKPGGIANLSENVQVSTRNIQFRGFYPVFSKDGLPAQIRFYDPDRAVNMALGLLPTGRCRGVVDIQPGGGAWQGRVENAYQPPMPLPVGAALESDPVWVSFGAAPTVMDSQYAWVLKDVCKLAPSRTIPRFWVTIPDTEGIAALSREAAKARSMGITHAVIPGNWEGRPGTLEGGAPRYPKNMAEAAKALQAEEVVPGITTDPLLGLGGPNEATAQSADGQTWVNLNNEAGMSHAVKRLSRLLDMGFKCIVVEASHIPDEVLAAFGLTRAQADALAFQAANNAIGERDATVLPTAGSQLSLGRDEWLEAASAVCRLTDFGVMPAPIRLRCDANLAPDKETLHALGFWRGAVEFVGAPPQSMQTHLQILAKKPMFSVRPQDAYNTSPLIWMARVLAPWTGYAGSTLIAFTGAKDWNLSALEALSGETAPDLLWQPQEARAVELTDGRLPAAGQLTTYGLLTRQDQPIYAGAAKDVTLGLDRIKNLAWTPERGLLSGQLEAASDGETHAFFLAPSRLKLRAAQVGGKKVQPVVDGQWIVLPLEGAGAAFELEFTAG